MREEYVPNEKYRNMFGVERNGYGMERVDLYLAQLEVAFKKIREDNRNLKRELSEQAYAAPPAMPMHTDPESAHQLAEQQAYIERMQVQYAELQEQNQIMAAQINEQSEGFAHSQHNVEALMGQITALRAEADDLRQQLRRQPGSQPGLQPGTPFEGQPAGAAGYEEDKQDLIGKVLVDAQARADETVRAARQEADQMTRKAKQRVEELRAEQNRILTQLQGISYVLRNALRETGEPEYKQRGEEFAAS